VAVLASGGSGGDRSSGGGGARGEAAATATTATEAGAGAAAGEERSFPLFQLQRSRHTKFDEDDDDDDDDERKQEKVDEEPEQQQQGKKKKKRRRRSNDDDEKEEATTTAPPPPPAPPPAAPCRLDLSLAAATIAVALRAPSLDPSANEWSQGTREGKRRAKLERGPAPRGNYSRYYGYRLTHLFSAASPHPSPHPSLLLSAAHDALYGPGAADPRLRSLLPYLGLFRGRRLLDVGCNGGVLTLALASAAGVSSALGVDADAGLVRSARARCLRMRGSAAAWEKGLRAGKEALEKSLNSTPSNSSSYPSLSSSSLLFPEPGGRSLAGRRAAARACSRALRATSFRHEDFVAKSSEGEGGGGKEEGKEQEKEKEQELFGAAVCLSVTKWVHLHHGDAGIERLFARLSRSLSKGAHLVLEPQPWRSYQRAVRKKGVRETLLLCCSSSRDGNEDEDNNASPSSSAPPSRSLASLKIRPEDFVSILEEPRHGFTFVRSLGAPEGAAPGFDRPLLLFRKK